MHPGPTTKNADASTTLKMAATQRASWRSILSVGVAGERRDSNWDISVEQLGLAAKVFAQQSTMVPLRTQSSHAATHNAVSLMDTKTTSPLRGKSSINIYI